MGFRLLWKLAFAASLLAGPALAGCLNVKAPCKVANGSYHIRLPAERRPDMPIVLFLHGYGSNGNAMVRNKRIAGPILARGYAFIAPNGLKRKGGRATSWNFHPKINQGRNEVAFLSEVINDAAKKYGLDRSHILLAGFSIGGSMVSYIACNNPGQFTAFAPVSGSFWKPRPRACKAPVKLFHTHGWKDNVVPLEGRGFNSEFIQGDVFDALQLWRKTNLCSQQQPDKIFTTGIYMRRIWQSCDPDSALQFALFPGGHTVPKGWANMVLNWYEGLPGN